MCLPCAWVVSLCVLAGFAGTAAAADPTPAECDARVNDTPSKLVECIQKDDLWTHMEALDDIAQKNPSPADHMPSRNSGEPGYYQSALYVKKKMEEAGYNVTLQKYPFTYYAYTEPPTFTDVSTGHSYAPGDEWNPGQSTGQTGDAQVEPAGGIVIPPTPTTSSTSGCTMADFDGFTAGNVALIQRGGCNFGVKVQNAEAAHASGAIIFNEGNPDRTELLNGSLQDAADRPIVPDIPVAFTSYDTGKQLLDDLPIVNISIKALVQPNADDWNVIAESKGGDKNHVVVGDAHLDAIYGEGMLDNASGSVTLLDVAEKMKNVTPKNKLRFIWFGGEELGLLGSEYYVNHLSSTDASHIGYDLDADVTATPNYIIGILDPAGPDLFGRTSTSKFPNRVYKASTVARDYGVQFFDKLGMNHEFLSPVGTDAFEFNTIGVPASGVLTGQDCCKSKEEVDLFGGHTGNFEGNVGDDPITDFDGGCVDNPFRWCDNLDNNDPNVLTFMSKAFGDMVVRMAFDDKVMSASDSANYKPKDPITAETGRHFAVK
jgi:Zn-dependent M28 family amino/carboxypeptidase